MTRTAALLLGILLFGLTSHRSLAGTGGDLSILVSVPDQKLAVLRDGMAVAKYPISTSRFGLGDRFNSYATPLGRLEVAAKIGDNVPVGTVFRKRQPTREILPANSKGRDPIVTRILWLRGLDETNQHAFARCIYIHGTPVESLIGRKASYGCIRMRSADIVKVFNTVGVGTPINILNTPLRRATMQIATTRRATAVSKASTAAAPASK